MVKTRDARGAIVLGLFAAATSCVQAGCLGRIDEPANPFDEAPFPEDPGSGNGTGPGPEGGDGNDAGEAKLDGGLSADGGTSTTPDVGGTGNDAGVLANDGATPLACDPATPIEVAPTPLLRLNRTQLDNALSDLFGEAVHVSSLLGADERLGPFPINGATVMTRELLQQYQFIAEQMGARALEKLNTLAPCTGTDQISCARQFIQRFGKRVFRRTLTPEERDRWLALYELESADGGYSAGIRAVVEGLLQSPNFLFRIEIPPTSAKTSTSTFALSGTAIAARLSFLLWDSPPDVALIDAAERGDLDTDEGLAREIDRLLGSPKARRMIASFAGAWGGLEALEVAATSTTGGRGLGPDVLAAMRAEANTFLEEVLLKRDGRIETLFTAPWTVARPLLAQEIYGLDVAGDPAQPAKIELDAAERAGILTQASYLFSHSHTNQTSPVLRGKWVRESLLCQDVPDPPPTVVAVPPPPRPGQTTRERYSEHRDNPTCAGCHVLLDDLGFGLEAYDQVGRHRTTDQNRPVDEQGRLASTDVDGDFSGAVQLGQRLAESNMARSCFAQQWARLGLGRETSEKERCLVQAMADAQKDRQGFRDLLLTLVKSDAFRMRRNP